MAVTAGHLLVWWSGQTKRPRIRGLRFRGLESAQCCVYTGGLQAGEPPKTALAPCGRTSAADPEVAAADGDRTKRVFWCRSLVSHLLSHGPGVDCSGEQADNASAFQEG